MKCIKCGHGMEPAAPLTLSAEVRGELFTVQVVAAKCAHCDRVGTEQQGASDVPPSRF